MMVLVSIVIPTHNRALLLKRAVYSVLAQTIKDIEVIIINDASKDNTAEVLAMLRQHDPRIHVIHHDIAQGGSAARNIGINASSGKWIAFLDDDDSWHPQKLEKQLKLLARHPNAVASNCFYTIHYPGKIKKLAQPPQSISLQTLLSANVLGGTSVCMVLASLLKQLGGFDPSLRSAQDWDLWVKIRLKGEIVTVCEGLVDYYVHFNYRISNDMRAKYIGARRFYFKYQALMNKEAKTNQLTFICFICSRQTHRPFKKRLTYLTLALKGASFKKATLFILSSLPRMLIDHVWPALINQRIKTMVNER